MCENPFKKIGFCFSFYLMHCIACPCSKQIMQKMAVISALTFCVGFFSFFFFFTLSLSFSFFFLLLFYFRSIMFTVLASVRQMRNRLLEAHSNTESALTKDAVELKRVVEGTIEDIADLHTEVRHDDESLECRTSALNSRAECGRERERERTLMGCSTFQYLTLLGGLLSKPASYSYIPHSC